MEIGYFCQLTCIKKNFYCSDFYISINTHVWELFFYILATVTHVPYAICNHVRFAGSLQSDEWLLGTYRYSPVTKAEW